MKRPLIFTGKKISLAPPLQEDAQHFFQWINDTEVSVALGYGQNLPLTLEQQEEWYQKNALKQQDQEKTFAIIENKKKRVVGNISLKGISHVNKHAELGIIIGDKKVWSKGYGSEAIILLLNYAFMNLNLYTVHLWVVDYNAHAIRAYERVGFKKTGTFRKHTFMNGMYHDYHIMDMLQDEYIQKYKKKK